MYSRLVGKYFFSMLRDYDTFLKYGWDLEPGFPKTILDHKRRIPKLCRETDSHNQTQAIAGVCRALKLSLNVKSTILNDFHVILYLAFITLVSADYQVPYVIHNASILHRQCPYLYELRHCHVDGKRDNRLLLCQSAVMKKISNILILNYFDHRNIFGAVM